MIASYALTMWFLSDVNLGDPRHSGLNNAEGIRLSHIICILLPAHVQRSTVLSCSPARCTHVSTIRCGAIAPSVDMVRSGDDIGCASSRSIPGALHVQRWDCTSRLRWSITSSPIVGTQ